MVIPFAGQRVWRRLFPLIRFFVICPGYGAAQSPAGGCGRLSARQMPFFGDAARLFPIPAAPSFRHGCVEQRKSAFCICLRCGSSRGNLPGCVRFFG